MARVLIKHSCGHAEYHAAWGKRVDWLATKPCPACAGLRVGPAPQPTAQEQALLESVTAEEKPDKYQEKLPAGYVREYRFCPPRKWRFDYAWPKSLIALEVEGGAYVGGRHSRGRGMENDMDKYNHAAFMGWRVFRVTPRLLEPTVTLFIARLLE